VISALRRLTRVRPTLRGAGLLGVGGALLIFGLVGGLPDIVGLATATLAICVVAWLSQGLSRLNKGRGALSVSRAVLPMPVVRGEHAQVNLTVTPTRPTATAYERLSRLHLSEQTAPELVGETGLRAGVRALPDRIEVGYALAPLRRGRWELGPLLATRQDAFGLARITAPLGSTNLVPVWPRTAELSARVGLLGELEASGAGMRMPSADDVVLRDYVPGDDPRRVHWPTAARQSRLMVRADEGAGMRPVTVLLDLGLLVPPGESESICGLTPDDGEWAVELAASIACAVQKTGHPTRLVATQLTGLSDGAGFVSGAEAGRATLLDETVDLVGHRTDTGANTAMAATTLALRQRHSPGEVFVAILRPQSGAALRELTALGTEAGACWGLLVDTRRGRNTGQAVDTLRSAGWRLTRTAPRTPMQHVWTALLEGAA